MTEKTNNGWNKFKCWLFGHKLTCCGDILKRCSTCHEKGRVYPDACNSCNRRAGCKDGTDLSTRNCGMKKSYFEAGGSHAM